MKHEVQPGLLLRKLASRCIEVAKSKSSRKDIKNAWSGVGFSICGQTLVAPIGEVIEIITVPDYTFIPAVRPWMLGLANVRGRLLPIVDVEQFFGGRLSGGKRDHRVLVIEINGEQIGLVVSKVFGLQHFATESIVPVDKTEDQVFLKFVDAVCIENEQKWYRFSPATLATDAEFDNASLAVSHADDTVQVA